MGYKVKKIMVGTQQVRPAGWHPGSNTLAYWTLNGTLNDVSGNNRNAIGSSNITYQTLSSGLQVVKLTDNNSGIEVNGNVANLLNGDFTISMWIYITGQGQSSNSTMIGFWYDVEPYNGPIIFRGYSGNGKVAFRLRGGSNRVIMQSSTGISSIKNKWIHICWTRINGQNVGYINANQECSMSSNIYTSNGNSGFIVSRYGSSGQSLATGSMGSNVIIENKGWTDTEITNYYNQTKSNYGL